MKKILAILLAVIAVFSLGITAFAEGEENTGLLLPEFPTQTEGAVYFASENIYVEAGTTYEVPVYMLSNYTASTEGDVVVGLTLSLAGQAFDANLMKITALSVSEDVQAMAGYELVGCDVNYNEEFNLNMVTFKVSDMGILNQEKLEIATVTIEVADAYTGYNEDGSPMDCMLDILPAQYFWYFDSPYQSAMAPVEIYQTDAQDAFFNDGWVDPLETVDCNGLEGPVFFSAGHLIIAPPVPTWEERLKAWAIEQAIKIITFFQGLNEVLLGLLPTL